VRDTEIGGRRPPEGRIDGRPGGPARRPGLGESFAQWVTLARSPVRVREALLRRRFLTSGIRERQLDLDNGAVHCWSGGSGTPVILLHGFGASALWQWFPQVPQLARSFALFLPDLLFFGQSTTSRPERSIGFQAETILQMADRFGLSTFDLVGLSYGGFVALSLAAQRPDRARRLCLVDSPGYAMRAEDMEDLLRRFGVPHIRDLLLPSGATGVRRLIEIAWHRPPWVPGFILRDTHAALFTRQVEEQAELLGCALEELGREPGIPLPLPQETLILWGEHDPVFPLHLARRLQAQLGRSAETRVLEDTAHSPNMERPALFNQMLTEFLSR